MRQKQVLPRPVFYVSLLFLGLTICLGEISFCKRKSPEERQERKQTSVKSKNSSPLYLAKSEKPSQLEEKYSQPRARTEQMEAAKKKKLAAIRSLNKAQELKEYMEDPDRSIRRAAILRLGEIGGKEAVGLLCNAFQKEVRVSGLDVPAGIKGEILDALARTKEKDAKSYLIQTVKSYLQEGPLIKGDYSHLYDPQYYAIIQRGIAALRSFPEPESIGLIESIATNSSLFYTLRETAWESLFLIKMEKEGFQSVSDRVYFLLSKIEPEGIFIENWWEKPGQKTVPALKESAVENLLKSIGWDAVDIILTNAESMPTKDDPKLIASLRVISFIMLEKLSKEDEARSELKMKETLMAVLSLFDQIIKEKASSDTVADIYKRLYAAAEIIHDKTVWEKIEKIHEKIRHPDAWKEGIPTIKELGLILPPGSEFVQTFSSRVESPLGLILRIYYFCEKPADEIVSYFEKMTGIKAEKNETGSPEEEAEIIYNIEFAQIPKEVAGYIRSGVTIFYSKNGFEERAFGRVLKRGKSMFKITRIISP